MARLRVSLQVFVRKLALMTRRSRLDDELHDEVRLHVDLRRQGLIERGMDPGAAEIEARRLFGNATAIREQTRDMWGFPSIDTLWQDIRYGARLLRRSPTVTLASVASLGIGIGLSASVFSLADVMLLQKLPVPAPDRLVAARWRSGPVFPFSSLNGNASQNDEGLSSTSFALHAFRQAHSRAAAVIDLFGFADLDRVNLSIAGMAELGEAQAVSGNYFSALGAVPSAGRVLVESDDRASAPPAVVIGAALWKRRFAGSQPVGQPITINGRPFTVVGVMPASFHGAGQVGSSPDVYVPVAFRSQVVRDDDDETDPNFWWILMMGRLKPGATLEQAQAPLDAAVKETVRGARPGMVEKDLPSVQVFSGAYGQVEVRDGVRDPLRMMSLVVSIVLLVACANVANLLLARGRARLRELSVRIALGASRQRLIRQLLTEAVLLAVCGSALGLVAARWMTAALLPALDSGPDPMAIATGLNLRVLVFVAVLASACVVLVALVPALRATNVSLVSGLHEAGRGPARGRDRRGVSTSLVIAQITLSMVLVATALLLVQSIRQLQLVELGFKPDHLLTFKVDPTLNGYPQERVLTIYANILDRLRVAPGVRGATLSSHTLISNSSSIRLAARTDEPIPDRAGAQSAAYGSTHRAYQLAIDPQFFSTMGIRLERGRALADGDRMGSPLVAVVNYALARQLFNADDVVGRRFRTEMQADAPLFEIVGVCTDALYTSVRRSKPPTFYVPYQQGHADSMTFEVRTDGEPAAFAATARAIVREVDPNLPLFRVQSQEQQIASSVRRERVFTQLALWLGVLTVTISAIGLYALLAYAVSRRIGEIGIRMALGARRADVRWMILRQSIVVAAWGLAFGIAASVVGTKLLAALLFNVAPRDPITIGLAAGIMLVVSLVAGYAPARRAASVDPLIALRAE